MKITYIALAGLLMGSGSVSASVVSFSDLATFESATVNTLLVDDFEDPALASNKYILAPSFYRNGVLYQSLNSNNIIIVGDGVTNFGMTGAIGSQVLTGNGEDDFSFVLDVPVQALGFNTYLNTYCPAEIKIYGQSGLLGTYTQDHNVEEVGFFGVVSSESISKVEWRTDGGAIQNAGIDNLITATAVSAVPEPSTYALMLGGLGLVGFMARRRKQRVEISE